MIIIDSLLFILFAVVYPIVGFYGYRRQLALAKTGQGMERQHMYRHTMRVQWGLLALLLLVWWFEKRDLALLGVPFQASGMFYAALGLGVATVAFFYLQLKSVRKAGQDKLTEFRNQLGDVQLLVPRTRPELKGFYRLSITAGIVEETIWRGYMISVLSLYMPVAAAAAISVIVFTLAHSYQGLKQLPGVGLIAIVLTLLFVMSGSIWLPMIVHMLIDAIQGRLSFEISQRSESFGSSLRLETSA